MSTSDKYANVRFLMIINGKRHWLNFFDCARQLDNGWDRVVDGALAIDVDGSGLERPLTEAEKRDITTAADEWSAMK